MVSGGEEAPSSLCGSPYRAPSTTTLPPAGLPRRHDRRGAHCRHAKPQQAGRPLQRARGHQKTRALCSLLPPFGSAFAKFSARARALEGPGASFWGAIELIYRTRVEGRRRGRWCCGLRGGGRGAFCGALRLKRVWGRRGELAVQQKRPRAIDQSAQLLFAAHATNPRCSPPRLPLLPLARRRPPRRRRTGERARGWSAERALLHSTTPVPSATNRPRPRPR